MLINNQNRNHVMIGVLFAYSLISTTIFLKSYLQYSRTIDSLAYDVAVMTKQLSVSEAVNEDVKKQRKILIESIKVQNERIDELHDEVKLHSEVIDSLNKKYIKKTR